MAKSPLYEALKKSGKKDSVVEIKSIPMPRIIELKKDEVGEVKPGDQICVEVYADVKSIDDEGRIMGQISRIEPSEMTSEENSEGDKSEVTMTQESHTP